MKKKHRHKWSAYWKVKSDGHYERLCHTCGAIDILFKKKGVRVRVAKKEKQYCADHKKKFKKVPQMIGFHGDIINVSVCEMCAEGKHSRCRNYVCFPSCQCLAIQHSFGIKKWEMKYL